MALTQTRPYQKECVAYRHRDCGDLSALRLDVENGCFLLVCGCGWRGTPAERVRDAAEAWQSHRNKLR